MSYGTRMHTSCERRKRIAPNLLLICGAASQERGSGQGMVMAMLDSDKRSQEVQTCMDLVRHM